MKVTVIIPVYNAASFVAQAAESALAQPETEQVILVEDGSADDSIQVCRMLAKQDTRVEVLQHPDYGNHGVAASRNLGISAARCEYIGFLDADDYYLPGRFDKAREIMANDASVDGVYDAVGTLHQDQECSQWYRDEHHPELITVRKTVRPETLFETLLADDGGYFITDGLVVRASIFARTGIFDTSLRICEDSALWLKMAAVGRLVSGALTEPVAVRRLHGGNITYQSRKHSGYYAIKMAESLLSWGCKAGLSRERQLLLVNALLNFHINEIPQNLPYVERKIRELRLYAGCALRHPLALRSHHYWSVVGASVGVKRWCRLWGRGTQTLSRA